MYMYLSLSLYIYIYICIHPYHVVEVLSFLDVSPQLGHASNAARSSLSQAAALRRSSQRSQQHNIV